MCRSDRNILLSITLKAILHLLDNDNLMTGQETGDRDAMLAGPRKFSDKTITAHLSRRKVAKISWKYQDL